MLSPIALNYMKFYPEPNVTVGVGATGTNNYSSSTTTTDNYSNELGRLDYNLSDKDRMFFDIRTATETQQKNNYFANPAEGSLLYRKPLGTTFDNVYVVNPTTVADLRLNFTRLAETHALPGSGFDPTSLGFPSYISADSQYLQVPIDESLHFPKPGRERREQLSIAIHAVVRRCGQDLGNHTIKFGADARQYRMNFIVDGNSTGHTRSPTHGSAPPAAPRARWLRAKISRRSCLACPPPGSFDVNSFGSFYNYYAALFVQDDWRVSRNLTVNFGLHYDHDGAVHEKYGRTVDGFDPTDPNPIAAAAMANYAKSPIAQIPVGASKCPAAWILPARATMRSFKTRRTW